MRIYKEYYNYQKVINSLKNDDKIKSTFLQNRNKIVECIKKKSNYETYIIPIIKEFKDGFILELGHKRENQVNLIKNLDNNKLLNIRQKQVKKGNNLIYYEGNEIINSVFKDSFIKIESKQIVKLMKTKILTCVIGEKNIFIDLYNSEYYYFDIGHLDNNVFISDFIFCIRYRKI